MKIIFLGYAVPPSVGQEEFSGLSIAGNKMQIGILGAFDSIGVPVEAVSILPLASFPRGRQLWSKKRLIRVVGNINSFAVAFVNIPVIKQLHQTIQVLIHSLIVARKGDVVLTFNAFPQIGIPALCLKFLKGITFVPFLADLPIESLENKGFIHRVLRFFFDKLTSLSILFSDRVVVLNKMAAEIFAPGKDFLCIEGGCGDEDINRYCALSKKRKNIVYTGALTAYSGIRELVAAMAYVEDEECFLEIYGSGPLEEEVLLKARTQKNVVFLGVKSHREILEIQSNAYLLINTRPVDDPISKVTFPSKIFEYMLSGTPVLTTRLTGFNRQFDDKVYFVDGVSPEEIALGIKNVLTKDLSELRSTAFRAFKFISEERSWVNNVKLIQEFVGCGKLKG